MNDSDVRQPERDAPSAFEQELKFRLPPARVGAVLAWLRGFCVPDPKFPHGIVSSIYFDTRSLSAVWEKLNSDYLKSKVRLRWYTDPANPDSVQPAFLEGKLRIGCRRSKVRLATEFDSRMLAALTLDDPRLADLPERLRSGGFPAPAGMSPVLTVRYQRYRFVEPASGARVAVDCEIAVPSVNTRLIPRAPAAALDIALVEVKGAAGRLPPTLYMLTRLGARKGSFSKYAACFREAARVVF